MPGNLRSKHTALRATGSATASLTNNAGILCQRPECLPRLPASLVRATRCAIIAQASGRAKMGGRSFQPASGGTLRALTRYMVLAILCGIPGVSIGQTISGNKVFGRYRQFVWNDRHGLPQNSVKAIVQGPDGYLWFGTAEGAVRFDGVDFTTYGAKALKQEGDVVVALLEDPSGALWFGISADGLTRFKDGVFTAYPLPSASPGYVIERLFHDRAGNLWIGTRGGGLTPPRTGSPVKTSWPSRKTQTGIFGPGRAGAWRCGKVTASACTPGATASQTTW